MQAAWSQMSNQLEEQKKLTNEIILKMTQQHYRNQWNKIAISEKIGTVICYGAAIALLFNFSKLDSLPLQISGVFVLLVLFILPIISLRTVRAMKQIDLIGNTYKQTMEAYVKNKRNFINFQKFNVGLSFIFMFAIMPVFSKLFNGKDFFETFNLKMLYAIPFSILFYILTIKYVMRYYKGVIKQSEAIMEEIKK